MVLVFAEHQKGIFKKAAFEAVTYGYKTAQMMGVDCHAIVMGKAEGADELGKYGAAKIHHIGDESLDIVDSQVYAKLLAEAAQKIDATVIVMADTSTGKTTMGRLAARLTAGSVSGAKALPEIDGDSFKVKKNIFSGKAVATYEIKSAIKLVSVVGNSIPPEVVADSVTPEALDLEVPAPKLKVRQVNRVEGTVPLPEAELVVSGGRGLKGPEHWGVLEELAEALGATTACSRPVSDADWRPHHEHVGQTGIAIRPNLYIAMGISGAIQHLAGVSNSKTIVVINKDPEAPFFKAADYGVVGDLFEVAPKLTEAVKKFRS